MIETVFVSIPPQAVFARYDEIAPNRYAIVTPRGKVLGESFYDLRDRFSFYCSITGNGFWDVLLPIQEPASQPSLF